MIKKNIINRNIKPILIIALSFILLGLCMSHTGSKAAKNVLPANVTAPSEDCLLVGVSGRYISNMENALARINEIRLEACNEGVISPSTVSTKKKKTGSIKPEVLPVIIPR